MRFSLFSKLAWNGIKKNKKTYIPYILSCVGMVMMLYIIYFLSVSPLLENMRGGNSLYMVLSLGKYVIAVFSFLFLFYTNSFLIRNRYKEFGLYNVLGVDKKGISRIIMHESIIVSVIGLVGGLSLGIVLSKLAELGLMNVIKEKVDYSFRISGEALKNTALIFVFIFFLLLLKSLWQVHRSKPLELMRKGNVGEKTPKGNKVIALIGMILLGTAYYLALSIKTPLKAFMLFFVAVILVIIATYMLFISGSVVLCRLLQKKKSYYYKKNHFVSVSSMAYRMKRNGAGLASICILSTMVLVMISSSSSLYFGKNESIDSVFFRDNQISVRIWDINDATDENISQIRAEYEKVFNKYGVTPNNVYEYKYAYIEGLLTDTVLNSAAEVDGFTVNYDNIRTVYFVSVDDFNRLMGTRYSLDKGQSLIYTSQCNYDGSTISIADTRFNIVGHLDSFISMMDSNTIIPSIMLVIPDYETLVPLCDKIIKPEDSIKELAVHYYYGYDIDVNDQQAGEIFYEQTKSLQDIDAVFSNGELSYISNCRADEKSDFVASYGGLFFIGIILSIIFIFAAAMIIYYKQISEGYEDRARFDIMQKVGMTKRDIKKSINSQILTVFFAPLLCAGVHLAFAFPMVWKILKIFEISNLSFVIFTTVVAFLGFAVFYIILYKMTARTYFSIVAAGENNKDN